MGDIAPQVTCRQTCVDQVGRRGSGCRQADTVGWCRQTDEVVHAHTRERWVTWYRQNVASSCVDKLVQPDLRSIQCTLYLWVAGRLHWRGIADEPGRVDEHCVQIRDHQDQWYGPAVMTHPQQLVSAAALSGGAASGSRLQDR
jgi:hypothetical protein